MRARRAIVIVASCHLDSRLKIVPQQAALESLRAHPGWVAVTGYFDPLTAAHARRLAEIRSEHSGIIVFLSEPADPVLPAAARAELLAALRSVDAVVLPGPGAPDIDAIHEERADETRLRELIERVRQRREMVLER